MAALFRITVEADSDGTWHGKVEWPFRDDDTIIAEVWGYDPVNIAKWVDSYSERLGHCLVIAMNERDAYEQIRNSKFDKSERR